MVQQTGVQVGIIRYAKTGAGPSCGGVGPQLPEGPRKQSHAATSLFALLSKPCAAQPSPAVQQTLPPSNKKPCNALTAIFRPHKPAPADDTLQQRAFVPPEQLQQSSSSRAASTGVGQRRQETQPVCSQGTQLPASPTAVSPSTIACTFQLQARSGRSDEDDIRRGTGHDNSALLQQSAQSTQQQAQQHQQQARLEECPLCGAQLPAEQLQQHVDEELQEIEELERSQQSAGKQQQQQALHVHAQLQQDQQRQADRLPQLPRMEAWQLAPEQQCEQPAADPQQIPLKPLQLPRLNAPKQQARSRLSQQHKQQQPACQPDQFGSTGGGEHGPAPLHYEQQSWQQQQPRQLQQQQGRLWQQWPAQTTGQRHFPEEDMMHEPPTHHQSAASHRQQPQASKPLQLPKLKSRKRHDKHQCQHSRKRSSSAFSSVTTLNLAPTRATAEEPKSAVLDTFDHWGDTTINWLDDSMIGLEGAPQSAGECWEGIGRCAAGPRTLR